MDLSPQLAATRDGDKLALFAKSGSAVTGFTVTEMQLESTDLRRLTLSPPMRLVLQSMFLAARAAGLQNRLFAIARPRAG